MPKLQAVLGIQSAGEGLQASHITDKSCRMLEGACSILWLLVCSQAHGTEPW